MECSTSNPELESILDQDTTFESFQLDDRLLRGVGKIGFKNPTLIQAAAIPLALQGKDILARARTGSGKTAAYSIPIIQNILSQKEQKGITKSTGIQALILVPTRELCEQVKDHFEQIKQYCKNQVQVLSIGGDVSLEEQRPRLRENPDVLITTPSRLVAHLQAKNINLTELKMLVIDEADLVLSFGYEEDIQTIKTYLPKVCQGFLMSATLSAEVETLKKLVLHTPAVLKLEETKNENTQLTEYAIKCTDNDKFLIAYALLRLRIIPGKALFFVNDIEKCYKLKLFFERFSIRSAVLNSELPHNSRYHIIQQFNRGTFDYLIATDESFQDEDVKEEEDKMEEDEEANESEEDSGKEEEEDEEKSSDEESDDDESSKDSKKDKSSGKKTEKSKKNGKKGKKGDAEYGVARGVDFKGVQTVINFDFPRSHKSYVHRIGRTARGKAEGTALSLVTEENTDLLMKVETKRSETGAVIQPYRFNISLIEGFRYRVEDQLRSVTRKKIRDARLLELKNEIMNSEKLKDHFKENPFEMDLLRHDMHLQAVEIRPHLKHIPDYLVPASIQQQAMGNRGRAGYRPRNNQTNPKRAMQRQKTDPLQSFAVRKEKKKRGFDQFMDPPTAVEVDESNMSKKKMKAEYRKQKKRQGRQQNLQQNKEQE